MGTYDLAVPSLSDRIATLRRPPTLPTQIRFALAAVIAQTGIVITGGVVRLSKSGLGCPTWPRCSRQSLLPGSGNPHGAIHQAIEYSNRSLTTVVMAVAVICVVGFRRARGPRDPITKLAWLQPLGVVGQIVLGGITVLVNLNPIAVCAHFMLSMLILAAAWTLYARTRAEADPGVPSQVALLSRIITGVVFALLIAGTIVTGTGPHAGDNKSPRFGFHIDSVTQLHADLVWLTIGLTGALWAVKAFAVARAEEMTARYVSAVEAASCDEGKVAALAAGLSDDGYSSGVRNAPTGVQLCQHHCPVAHVAHEFPQLCEAETEAFSVLLGSHIQRLATIAHGDGVCTTHVPSIPSKAGK